MPKLLVLLTTLLGCLFVAQVSASPKDWFGGDDGPKPEFYSLDKYLSKKVAKKASPEDNFAYIKSNVDKLPAGVKEEGRRFVELVERLDKVKYQCSSETVSILLDLVKTGLKVSGETRVEKILSNGWSRAEESCKVAIENLCKDNPTSKTSWFMFGFNTFPFESSDRRSFKARSEEQLWHSFRRVVRQLPETEYLIKTHSRLAAGPLYSRDNKKFETAVEELVMKPCRHILDDNELVENMANQIVADSMLYEARFKADLEVYLEDELKAMNWTRDLCTRLVKMNAQEKRQFFGYVPLPGATNF